MTLKEAIQAILRQEMKTIIKVGKVVSFDKENSTCEVDLISESEITDVRIRAAIDGSETGILVEPKVGSVVLIGLIENKDTSAFVIGYTEIENYTLKVNKVLKLQGDNFGGLVKLKELEDNLNALKQAIETIKSAVSTGLTAVGVSTAANGPAGAASYNSAVAAVNIKLQDMENKKVKHGE